MKEEGDKVNSSIVDEAMWEDPWTWLVGLAVFVLLAAYAPLTLAGGGAGAAPPGKFEGAAVEELDPDRLRGDLADGEATITLRDRTFDLSVEQVPWETDIEIATPGPNGSWSKQKPKAQIVAYVGTVIDDPASRVLVTLTADGADGFVETERHRTLHFEPLSYYDREAPSDQVVAYYPHEVVLPTNVTDVVDSSSSTNGTEDDGGSDSNLSVASHQPGPDRDMMLWMDSDYWNEYGSTSKAVSVFNRLNTEYNDHVGFTFSLVNGNVYRCTDTACDSEWGMTSTDAGTLRDDWAGELYNDCACPDYDIAHLETGKDLDSTVIGISYLPGRYAVSQVIDGGGSYQGGSSSYEAGILVSHEVGHNFNGRHQNDPNLDDRTGANQYQHDHGFDHTHYHCHGVEIAGNCLPSGYHEHTHHHYDWYDHYTTMWTPFSHQPSNEDEMRGDFSDDNYEHIRNCNNFDWSEGSFQPGHDPGMGFWCDET